MLHCHESIANSCGLHIYKLIFESVFMILWTAVLTNDLKMSSVSIAFGITVKQYLPIEVKKKWSNNISLSDIVVFQYSTLQAGGINHWEKAAELMKVSLWKTKYYLNLWSRPSWSARIRFGCSVFYICMI